MSRKALRDFYRLQAEAGQVAGQTEPVENGKVQGAEDAATDGTAGSPDQFSADEFIARAEAADLVELVRTHRELLAEKQVLDSDQKALIYNNYKKLIEASDKLDGIDSHSARIVSSMESIDKIAALDVTRTPGELSNFADLRAKYLETYDLAGTGH